MFEKEAEEYSNNWKINKNNDLNFAELVELRAVIYKANKDGAEFGYNKANEWHYVKNGDLPKAEFVDEYKKPRLPSAYKRHYCLCLGDDCIMGKYIKGSFSTVEGHYSLDEVVAWKEIVLPELKESE